MIIPIKPMPKQSVRGGKFGVYQPAEIRKYVSDLKWLIKSQWRGGILSCPVVVSIKYYFKAPKSTPKKILQSLELEPRPHAKRPDLDNLTKPVLDAMSGICFLDDSQVIGLRLEKWEGLQDLIEIDVCRIIKNKEIMK